ncbi:MAG: sulfatase [Planctomycetota bacterium]
MKPLCFVAVVVALLPLAVDAADRPNVLICISDDQSFPHASVYGTTAVSTPGFDRVARQGVLFHNAFTPAPGCSPMRASLLTGRYIWQNGPAGTHASSFPKSLQAFPDQLESAGYAVGYTGKGWGPGNWKDSGRSRNPAGPSYSDLKVRPKPAKGIRDTDYAANFESFLKQRDKEQPFCFWYGGSEPHRTYDPGIGRRNGIPLDEIQVPGFLPDNKIVRSDLADYLYEIQWFDSHLVRMLDHLESTGQLKNTLVIVTSDNGMPFPRAKANLYEFGIHMPLAISWPQRFRGGKQTSALVNLIDLTATIYDATAVDPPGGESALAGRSLLPRLAKPGSPGREAVFSGRERHSSSRFNTLGYPCRAARTDRFLYIRNYHPQRWPAGAPRRYQDARFDEGGRFVDGRLSPPHSGYHDIDAGPTLTNMTARLPGDQNHPLLDKAVAFRPAEELYDVIVDPACLSNLAEDAKHAKDLERLSSLLEAKLTETGDVRQIDPENAEVWERYPRYSSLRWFPVPDWLDDPSHAAAPMPWLESRRPRVDSR